MSSKYASFGSTMPGRNYQSSSSYRYGMNGQEKDDEIVSGLYTAEYWEYDSRLGRRWNVDPIVKSHESPYAAFGNNPIIMVDPNGADAGVTKDKDKGTATIKANVFLVKGKTSQKDFDNYASGYKGRIDAAWNNKTFQDADGTNYTTVTDINVQSFNSQADLDKFLSSNSVDMSMTNILTVGTDDGKADPSAISYVNGNGNSGFMNVNGSADAHEFGHLLGLGDRYQNYISVNPNNLPNEYSVKGSSGSVPSLLPQSYDADYALNRSGNLMSLSTSGGVVTKQQFQWIFGHNQYVRPGSQGFENLPFAGAQLYFTTLRNPSGLRPGMSTNKFIASPGMVTPGSANPYINANYGRAHSLLFGR